MRRDEEKYINMYVVWFSLFLFDSVNRIKTDRQITKNVNSNSILIVLIQNLNIHSFIYIYKYNKYITKRTALKTI